MSAACFGRVRLLVLDVDGVLTDGSVVVGPDGGVSKRFFVRDGSGIVRLQRAGVPVCWLSGRSDSAAAARAAELRVARLVAGCHDKAEGLESLALSMGVSLDAVAFVGDDLLDLPAIALAGLSIAPADAIAEVRAAVDLVSTYVGGRGVVRWVCDQIIAAKAEGV
jgi:3-deoxy-D-manno-octulosonate 8-phosphate phosphatase (KDO 8-P phosphatase)